MSAREETKTLITRQIAVFNGLNPSRVADGTSVVSPHYLTLAESILASVERKMRAQSKTFADAFAAERDGWK